MPEAGTPAGLFIVFEGIDGSGKSTQVERLAKRLKPGRRRVHTTFEPTEGPIGSLIRQMLKGTLASDQRTIATLFAADRTDHLVNSKNGIAAKVQNGAVVLCDRYYFSSYAYHAPHVDMEWVIQTNAVNAGILRPDLTIFIDVDPEKCFNRIAASRKQFELYENVEMLKKVREFYFKAFERLENEEHIEVIDGNAAKEYVEREIWHRVKPLL